MVQRGWALVVFLAALPHIIQSSCTGTCETTAAGCKVGKPCAAAACACGGCIKGYKGYSNSTDICCGKINSKTGKRQCFDEKKKPFPLAQVLLIGIGVLLVLVFGICWCTGGAVLACCVSKDPEVLSQGVDMMSAGAQRSSRTLPPEYGGGDPVAKDQSV